MWNPSLFIRLSIQSYPIIPILVNFFPLCLDILESHLNTLFFFFLLEPWWKPQCDSFFIYWQKSSHPIHTIVHRFLFQLFPPKDWNFFVFLVEKTSFTVILLTNILRCGQDRVNYCNLNGTGIQPAPRGYLYQTTVKNKFLYFWISSFVLSASEHALSVIPLDTLLSK